MSNKISESIILDEFNSHGFNFVKPVNVDILTSEFKKNIDKIYPANLACILINKKDGTEVKGIVPILLDKPNFNGYDPYKAANEFIITFDQEYIDKILTMDLLNGLILRIPYMEDMKLTILVNIINKEIEVNELTIKHKEDVNWNLKIVGIEYKIFNK